MAVSLYTTHTLYIIFTYVDHCRWDPKRWRPPSSPSVFFAFYCSTVRTEVCRGQRIEDLSCNTWIVINSYYYLNFSEFAANFSDIYGIYCICDVMATPLNHGG